MRFNLGDDTIDSRDIIKRIDELEDERTDLETSVEEATVNYNALDGTEEEDERSDVEHEMEIAQEALKEWDSDYGDELKNLKIIADEFAGYGDWKYGETLIEDGHFEDYARELAEDCCDMKNANSWPFTCIDWKDAARELQYDYTSVDVDGYTYWMRA